ncbi:hypothetical protein EV426DRAFT_547331 [Tirmania nivea]|nr:hypothetical protein EV426DRAFT_547331 [Tirmania nivea]
MKKTLLLVFVHGFQGDDNTFEQFPADLAGLTSHCLPQLTVLTKTYPCYATRGDLSLAVQNLRTWLQDLIIDLESRPGGSRHPTTNPSVRTILVCHSMGGIVSTDVLLGIIDEPTVSGKGERMMFPYIQGILAFDTPFLGLAPGMLAHNVDAKVKSAGEVVRTVGAIAGGLWGGLMAGAEATAKVDGSTAEEQSTAWSRWGKIAIFAAGAASIAAAGTAASIYKREEITAGFSWVTSHLEFVSELYKSEALKTRLSRASSIKGVGFANIYTSLGLRKANSMERTFCSEPQKESARRGWYKMVNSKADDEIAAHTGMFNGKTNMEYFWMRIHARDLVVAWAEGWQ